MARGLQQLYDASTKAVSLTLMRQFADTYEQPYPRAVECVLKDQKVLLSYFNYPQEHWLSLKTTNPIKSIFSTVKLRTNSTRRIRSPRSALYLIFQLIL